MDWHSQELRGTVRCGAWRETGGVVVSEGASQEIEGRSQKSWGTVRDGGVWPEIRWHREGAVRNGDTHGHGQKRRIIDINLGAWREMEVHSQRESAETAQTDHFLMQGSWGHSQGSPSPMDGSGKNGNLTRGSVRSHQHWLRRRQVPHSPHLCYGSAPPFQNVNLNLKQKKASILESDH